MLHSGGHLLTITIHKSEEYSQKKAIADLLDCKFMVCYKESDPVFYKTQDSMFQELSQTNDEVDTIIELSNPVLTEESIKFVTNPFVRENN